MEKPLYSIGDYVIVSSTATAEWAEESKAEKASRGEDWLAKKVLKKTQLNPLQIGIVVGMSRLMEGTKDYYTEEIHCSSSENIEPPEYVEHELFNCTKSHRVYLIRFGMLNKPVKVLPGDLDKIEPPPGYKFPMLFQGVWTEKMKNETSEESEKWPRDNKGRWSRSLRIGEEKNFKLITGKE